MTSENDLVESEWCVAKLVVFASMLAIIFHVTQLDCLLALSEK